MASTLPSSPLIGVEAVALDLETTGLDPRNARIVQIGAIQIAKGEVGGTQFSTLVDPGVPIPAAATAVHLLSNADVLGAPGPAEALAALEEFVAGRPIVGHAIGFDMAVLAAERKRLSQSPCRAPTLDTRLLGEIAAPTLPDYTLETLAAWLGLSVEARHTAPGDALTAAHIFCALIPHLRAHNVRTWAEADAACRRLARRDENMAGGIALPDAPATDMQALARVDSYPFRHRVAEVMSAPPFFIDRDRTLGAAIREMSARKISSVFVKVGGEAAILTERDVLRALASEGAEALQVPAGEFASRPLLTVGADAFVYRALARMNRLKVRHLGVTDESGALVGALSARDLLRLRTTAAITLGDAVATAEDVPALAAAWAPLPEVAQALLAEGVEAVAVAAVISNELAAVTSRATELAEAALSAQGERPPCSYALLVLGSAGRGESLLALDQDNAIVFRSGEPGGPEDRYFEKLGRLVADALDAAGVPYCKGGVMAREATWRGSLATWRQRIAEWLERSNPQDLLSVDIFFDAKPVHGDARLASGLLDEARGQAAESVAFLKLLAEASPRPPAARGFLGGWRTEAGRIDLKRAGLLPIVSAARILALRDRIEASATQDRLAEVATRKSGGATDLLSARAAHSVIVNAILKQQLADVRAGVPASNKVEVAKLSRHERDELKSALDVIPALETLVRDLLF